MKQLVRSSLFRHYTLLLISVFFLSALLYLSVSFGLSHYYLKQVQTKIHLHVADTIIKDHRLIQDGHLNESAISQTFQRYMLLNPHLQIYLLDKGGNILKYAADSKKIKRLHVNPQPIQTFLNNQNDDWITGDDPRSIDQQKPFSAAKLPLGNGLGAAYLYVIIQDSIEAEADRQLQESLMLKLSFYAFVASLIIGLSLGLLLFYRLIKRIDALSDASARFRQDYAKTIDTPSQNKDELDHLQQDMSQLSLQIQQQISQLQNADEQRRFMLSRLSHDLRTPLTNLLGYMEQVAKITAEDNHEDRYLARAYQNGLKLKHYLDQLFDFAKLDMQTFQLKKQELSLSEFCFDIFSQYQTQNRLPHWQIDINANFLYEFDPVYLESALLNLFDNAAKYGQGEVICRLQKQPKSLIFKVCNQGPTIEQQMQNSGEFSPFTIENTKGSGLGLSIVRAIVLKHDGQFRYMRENGFNCFEIALPI